MNVVFEEYGHDMKEVSDRAAQIIEHQKKLLKQKDNIIAELIIGSGGTIEINESVFYNITDNTVLKVNYDARNRKYFYEVLR